MMTKVDSHKTTRPIEEHASPQGRDDASVTHRPSIRVAYLIGLCAYLCMPYYYSRMCNRKYIYHPQWQHDGCEDIAMPLVKDHPIMRSTI